MREVKRFIIAAAVFLVVFGDLSAVFILPCWDKVKQYDDRETRAAYAGTIDTIFIGASQLGDGLDLRLFDEKLHRSSYSLSRIMMPWRGRYFFLRDELARNPVKEVYIEIAEDALSHADMISGMLYVSPALSSFSERAAILMDTFTPKNAEALYRHLLKYGIDSMKRMTGNKGPDSVQAEIEDETYRGFSPCVSIDCTLPEEEIESSYRQEKLNTVFRKDSLRFLEKMIQLCEEYGIRPTLIILPVPDAVLWKGNGWDIIHNKLSAFAISNGLDLYDFNLLKDRFSLFDDADSYCDDRHLAEKGASAVADRLCDLIEIRDSGQSVSGQFYDSYEEMIADSPYMQYYLSSIEPN